MAAYNKWLDNKKTFILVTGASRGLGKTICLRFAPYLGESSVFSLLARDSKTLNECKKEISELAPKVKVECHSVDLSRPNTEEYRKIVQSSLTNSGSKVEDFEQAIIVHNAATVGSMQMTVDAGDPDEWASYMQLNLVSPVCLNSVFFNIFTKDVPNRLLLNITSLAAFKPILSAPYYNTGKAARDHLFLTLANEEPSIVVLSYSPGPLQTDMMTEVLSNVRYPQTKKIFYDLKENNGLLTCDQTLDRLIDILKSGLFTSGVRIDYYSRT